VISERFISLGVSCCLPISAVYVTWYRVWPLFSRLWF